MEPPTWKVVVKLYTFFLNNSFILDNSASVSQVNEQQNQERKGKRTKQGERKREGVKELAEREGEEGRVTDGSRGF